MAQRRMFSLAVTDTDAFQDMPTSSQALYFHLGMHGDDDGFVGSPKKIARAAGCNADDLKLLSAKGFIIPFESGVVVIRDWRVNNTLKNDRYHETLYQAEKALLSVNKAGAYELGTTMETSCFQSGTITEPEQTNRTNVTNQTEQTKEDAGKPPRSMPRPSIEEVRAFCIEKGYQIDAEQFVSYYDSVGWKVGRNAMKNWKSAVVTWAKREGGKAFGVGNNSTAYAAGDCGKSPKFNVSGRKLD